MKLSQAAFMFIFARADIANGTGVYFANEKTGLRIELYRISQVESGPVGSVPNASFAYMYV